MRNKGDPTGRAPGTVHETWEAPIPFQTIIEIIKIVAYLDVAIGK